MDKIGPMAYLAGIGVAVLAALAPGIVGGLPVGLILAVTGLLVGLMNVSKDEGTKFLVALIAIPVASGAATSIPAIGGMLNAILTNVAVFGSAAAIVVAIKTVMDVASR